MSDTDYGEMIFSAQLNGGGKYNVDYLPFVLNVGTTYTVLLDGVPLEVECKEIYYETVPLRYLGNLRIASIGENTGENFIVFQAENNGYVMCSILTEPDAEDGYIAIYEKTVSNSETEPLSYIKFLCGTEFPYLPKNIWGWKMAQKRGE